LESKTAIFSPIFLAKKQLKITTSVPGIHSRGVACSGGDHLRESGLPLPNVFPNL
jgi:hypothetical protein